MTFHNTQIANQEYTPRESEDAKPAGVLDGILVFLTWILIAIFPIFWCQAITTIQDYERAVIYQLGRRQDDSTEKRGMFCLNFFVNHIEKVDIRTQVFDIPQQEVLSKDAVTIRVDAVAQYKIVKPLLAIDSVINYNHTTRLLAQTHLRNIMGQMTLQQILKEREAISHALQQSLDRATDPWGIQVESVEVKDIILPMAMQRAMAAEAEASREAKAKLTQAIGEKEAAKNIADAARMMATNPKALQLRYLQTLNTVAAQKNSTIVFPLPTEFLNK